MDLVTHRGGGPGPGQESLSWEVDLDLPEGADGSGGTGDSGGTGAPAGEVLGSSLLPEQADSRWRRRRSVVGAGLIAVTGVCAALLTGRPALPFGTAHAGNAPAAPTAAGSPGTTGTGTTGTGTTTGTVAAGGVGIPDADAVEAEQVVHVATLRRSIAFTDPPADWSQLTGPEGTVNVRIAQTALLVGDRDVPAAGGGLQEQRTRFRLSASALRAGDSLNVEEYTELHVPTADYRRGGKASCLRLNATEPPWPYLYTVFLGARTDYASYSQSRRRIAFYPASAPTGGAKPVASALSTRTSMLMPSYESWAEPCFAVAHGTSRYAVTVPKDLPPGHYRVALSSPAREITGVSIVKGKPAFRTADQIKGRVTTSLPLIDVSH
jgi:hypothetical protein